MNDMFMGYDIVISVPSDVNIVIMGYYEVLRNIMKYYGILWQWVMKGNNELFNVPSDVMKQLVVGCSD